jgi:hypothetical protein
MAAKQKVTIEIDGDGGGAEKAIGGVSASTVALGNIMSQVATAAVDLLATSIKTLGAEVMKSVTAAAESQKSQMALAAAMQTAGTFTKEALARNIEYASSLQKTTAYGDEEIMGVQKMLIAYGLKDQALQDATKATLDLAAATGKDLNTAGDMIAKTVGSEANALARLGIEMSDSTDKTQRAKEETEGIAKLFGGQASAQAKTFSGQITIMTNAMDDLYEEVGNAIIQNKGLNTIMVILQSAIADATKWVVAHQEQLGKLVKEGILFAISAVGVLVKAVAFLSEAWTIAGNAMVIAFSKLWEVISRINPVLIAARLAGADWIKTIDGMAKASREEVEEANISAKKRADFLQTLIDGIKNIGIAVAATPAAYQPLIDTIVATTQTEAAMVEQFTADQQKLIDEAVGYTEAQLTEFYKRYVGMTDLFAAGKISQAEYDAWTIKEGSKVNAVVAQQAAERLKTTQDLYSNILSISQTYSQQVLAGQKSIGTAMEDAAKASARAILDAEIDKVIKEIGLVEALEVAKATMGGFLSFGATLIAIPLIAAAATAAKAVIHGIVGFAGGGIVGPGGSKLPLPSFESSGSGAAAMIMAHEGEAVGTPATLAAAGIGGITVNVNISGGIASDLDADIIGERIGEAVKNKMRGTL